MRDIGLTYSLCQGAEFILFDIMGAVCKIENMNCVLWYLRGDDQLVVKRDIKSS